VVAEFKLSVISERHFLSLMLHDIRREINMF
jgi:hypothetical protein